MKRILSLVIFAVMLLGTMGVTAEIDIIAKVDNAGVVISGTGAVPEGYVTIQVFLRGNTGATLEELTPQQYLGVLACHDQTRAGADGSFAFSFDMDSKTGDYVAYLNPGDGSPVPVAFSFVNMDHFKTVVDTINAATSASAVETLIMDNKEALDLTAEDVAGVNLTSLSTIIYNYVAEGNQFSNTDRTATLKVINKAYLVQQLNEKQITNIYDYAAVNGLAVSSIKDWYQQAFVTEQLELDFTDRLSGKSFTTLEQYDKVLMEAFLLATIQNPNGYDNILKVANAFATDLSINTSHLTEDICKAIAGTDYTGLAAFKSAIAPQDGGTGGGGAIGGGAVGGGYVQQGVGTIDIEKEDNVSGKLPDDIFTDLDDYGWATDAIAKLAEMGVVNGKGDGKFAPQDSVTREEFVKMLVIALNISAGDTAIDFADADQDAWYYDYLKTAVAAGIVQGKGNGTFGIGERISRQDMAQMAYNAMKATGAVFDTRADAFADDAGISSYAKEAVYALKNKGIINGIGNNRYEPLAFTERAAAAKVIYMLTLQ